MLRTREYQGVHGGLDFIAYRLRSVDLSSDDQRHELYVQITYSGLPRVYRHARADGVRIDDFETQLQEATRAVSKTG